MSGNIKAFFVVIAVMMLVLSSCHMEKKENIYEGMSFEEFKKKLQSEIENKSL